MKSKRGGKREKSGRHKLLADPVRLSLVIERDTRRRLYALATGKGVSVSAWLRAMIDREQLGDDDKAVAA